MASDSIMVIITITDIFISMATPLELHIYSFLN